MKELKTVGISNSDMTGTLIKPILVALNTSIDTIDIKGLGLNGTHWNKKEAVEELVNFIATAPKLEWCSLSS